MSGAPDLTRWNRAGLARLRYVDGNAVTFLEELRAELAARFDGTSLPKWEALQVAAPESDSDRRGRIARQYDEIRGEWGWEIARAFARATHVLGEHLDAYANEGFLRTATQWDSVRKLVSMLDVYPAPPASASTLFVLEAKALGENETPGTVEPGFAARYTPKDGKPPIVFETLEELVVDPAANAMRLAGWNRSPLPLVELPPARPLSPLARRSARAVQGIGPVLGARLDAQAPFGAGFFSIADLERLDPAAAAARDASLRNDQLRLWEARSKADLLLDFPWTAGELAPIAELELEALLGRTAQSLARATGRSNEDMARLLDDLREAQMALDEETFRRLRLAELLAPGPPPPATPPLWQAPEDSDKSAGGISAGQVAILVRELAAPVAPQAAAPQAAVVSIRRVEVATGAISLASVPFQRPWESWTRGDSLLLARPKVIAVASLAASGGASGTAFAAAHDLAVGDIAAWRTGASWKFARVAAADAHGARFEGGLVPPAGADVLRAALVEPGPDGLFLPLTHQAAAKPSGSGFVLLTTSEHDPHSDDEGTVRLRKVKAGIPKVAFVPAGAAVAGRVAAAAAGSSGGGPTNQFRFEGKPGKLGSGQWVVGDDGTRLHALRIASIEELEDHFLVAFESTAPPVPAAGALAIESVDGIGPVYTAALHAARTTSHPQGVRTIAELARLSLSSRVTGLSATRLAELVTKARLLVSFEGDADDLKALLDQPLTVVLTRSAEHLADGLGKPLAWAADLLERLRLVQALLDESAFASLRVLDLLPFSPPRTQGGGTLTRLVRLYGVFAHTLRPSGWDRNDTPVSGARLELEAVPPGVLALGRTLVLERAAPAGQAYAREASVVTTDATARTLDLVPPLAEGEGFTRGNLILRGNVARAGHGESKPAKVLGSGDGARLSQRFVLAETNVAFVPDPTQPSGVAAALEVSVAAQVWQQVANLKDSKPSDPHFEAHLTEDGTLEILFGDGQHGRRLPTGTNNVRARFRVGTGLAGNLPAGSFTKPAKPHPLLAGVSQPLPATGGNDLEDTASLKSQAPASVLTLERAVSLADFAALAARQASVWQARAFALPTGGGRHASIEVVVVPAGGGALGGLAAQLTSFLLANAVPGVSVVVSGYRARPVALDVEVAVDSTQWNRDEVKKRVETALLEAFGLRRRALGAGLFTSEIYEVVEGVSGVANSVVVLGGNRSTRVLSAGEREVLFLDPAQARLTVSTKELAL